MQVLPRRPSKAISVPSIGVVINMCAAKTDLTALISVIRPPLVGREKLSQRSDRSQTLSLDTFLRSRIGPRHCGGLCHRLELTNR